MKRFEGKVAVITGGCGGIGRATALSLLSEGAKVALIDIGGPPLKKPDTLFVHGDVTCEESLGKALDEVMGRFSQIDIFVNAAGVIGPTTLIQDTTLRDFDDTFAVNVRGVFLGMKEAAKRMGPGGTIINFASDVGFRGWPGVSVYAASKAAVVSLTQTAALELGPLGIRVNGIAPSTIETTEEMSTEEEKVYTLAMQAMPRIMEPEEIARTVLFLASEDSSIITGQTIIVDGGWTAGPAPGLLDLILKSKEDT